MLADIVTVSRIPLSLFLLVLSPSSVPFAVGYVLCGVSDVADGWIARTLHTESRAGARLDSVADLFFAIAYAVKILPLLSVPVWVWIWTVLIAVGKIYGIIQRYKKERQFYIPHSFANKLTGILLFLLPFGGVADIRYGAASVCAVATVAAAKELIRYGRNVL